MFKSVEFFETAVPCPSDSEVEPTESHDNESSKDESDSSSVDDKEKTKKKGSENDQRRKHVRIIVDEDTSDDEEEDGSDKVRALPSFQKRPLSDTPVTSTWNSPVSSTDTTPLTSPETSSVNLLQLNQMNLYPETRAPSSGATPHANVSVSPPATTGALSPSKFPHPSRRPTTIDVPGLTKSKSSPDGLISKDDPGSKLVIVMVGLPATGKSFITNKLSRYLNFSMYFCKVFNVGNTRRQFAKEHGLSDQDSKFFDPGNNDFSKLRDKWAMDTLEQLLDYLLDGPGSVGIFDATNTTKERRKHVLSKIRERNSHLKVLFLESVCSDKAVVEKNIQLKLFGPDYKGKDPASSLKDFKERLANYMRAYEPIEDDEDVQFIKMIDVGKKVIAYKIQGFLASQTVYYLLNFNLTERQIWITRNGESEDNVLGRLGGDSNLTPRGERYARALAKFIDYQRSVFYTIECEKRRIHPEDDDHQCNEFFVWTSMRKRSLETAAYFNEEDYPIKQMRMLDELSAGDYEGMTYPEIQEEYPEEFDERRKDKLRYRYPGIGGESYMDVTNRLRPVIAEIERIEDNVLIITHRVVARVLLGYFMNLSKDIIANVDVPLHCVYCLELKPYGISWALWEFDEENNNFFKVPESEMNTTKVKENELVYKERRYSLVPTAPPSANNSSTDIRVRRSGSSRSSSMTREGNNSSGSAISEDNEELHTSSAPVVPFTHAMSNSTHLMDGGGTSISTNRPRKITTLQQHVKSSLLANNEKAVTTRPATCPRQMFEIDKLNEKLANLKAAFPNKNNEEEKKNTGKHDDNENGTSSRILKMTRSHSQA